MSLKEFQILNRLGEGSFSSVWKAKRLSDGKEYAMKKVKMGKLSEKEKQNALNEVRILASIQSPYIIGYKEAFLDDSSMTLCIIMEFAPGGDILHKIEKHRKNRTSFTETEIWAAFIQMLRGLKILHDNKILHRDLKCANVFLAADGVAKLGDLNVSKVAKNDLVYTQTGTPYYASPEVWKDKPYDSKCDIWSLGCVIYEMAALKPPFRANDMQGLFRKVQKGVFDKIPSHYSKDLFDIIALCLQISPSARPSCDQLLNHPIVVKHANNMESMETEETVSSRMDLLKTIKMPRNPKALIGQLPRANYQSSSLVLDEEMPTPKSKKDRAGSANVRINTSHSRDSGSMDVIREGKHPLIAHEESVKVRIVRANPGLPPRKELGDLKRPVPNQIQHNDASSILTPKKNYVSDNDSKNLKEGYNKPPLGQSPSLNRKQSDIISKYQKIDPRIEEIMNKYDAPLSYRRLLNENNPDRKLEYLLRKYNPEQFVQKAPSPNNRQYLIRNPGPKNYNDVLRNQVNLTPNSKPDSQRMRNSPSEKVSKRPIWRG